jgi:predicted GH43/DUF377 family glycosyl hydrolase
MRPRSGLPAVTLIAFPVLLLTACSGPSTSGRADPSESASEAQTMPSLTFAFTGETPVVTRQLAGHDESWMNPGAVIEHEGVLHMFGNVFSNWPGQVAFPHLVSNDGVAWTKADSSPAFTSDDIPYVESGADVSAGYVTPDGTWVLVFETVELSDPWVLGRATAPGPDGPWTIDPEPILTPGPTGSFDSGGLQWPSVVQTDDGYLLYFTAIEGRGGPGSIGLATSSDGLAWEKHDGPVLAAALDWERGQVDRPRVAVTPRGLAMVYAGGRLTDRGLAWSEDGVTWQRDGELPVITRESFPISGSAWDAALVYRDGALDYYLEIGSASGVEASTDIYLASAPLP